MTHTARTLIPLPSTVLTRNKPRGTNAYAWRKQGLKSDSRIIQRPQDKKEGEREINSILERLAAVPGQNRKSAKIHVGGYFVMPQFIVK